jgi:NTE family protein
MAAELYDEILFQKATFADLVGKPGPVVIATATDISTGSRLGFVQGDWDLICSDLSKVPLSRAAAASSAVPMALSPVTINNYGGTCSYVEPSWVRAVSDPKNRARPAGRALQRYKEMQSFQNSAARPYLHLVDGGVSDNLGMRAVLEGLEAIEASAGYRSPSRGPSRMDKLRRIVVFVVNSLSVPKTDWDTRERPPNDLLILLKATGVPIDRYSYESVELLKDMIARWQTLRAISASNAFVGGGNPMLARAAIPDIELYAIDVSFDAIPDAAEREFLNQTPTSFVLTDDQVDRLRAAAGAAIRASPEFARLLRDLTVPASTAK